MCIRDRLWTGRLCLSGQGAVPSHGRPVAVRLEGAPALGLVPTGVAEASVPVCVAGRPAAPGARRRRLGRLSGHPP
eukprot:493102-Alexandrium_andersonii.AAC.1